MDKAVISASIFTFLLSLSLGFTWLQTVLAMTAAGFLAYGVYKAVVSITHFMNVLTRTVRHVDNAVQDIGGVVNDLHETLADSIKNIDKVVNDVHESVPDVKKTLKSTRRITRTANNSIKRLTPHVEEVLINADNITASPISGAYTIARNVMNMPNTRHNEPERPHKKQNNKSKGKVL